MSHGHLLCRSFRQHNECCTCRTRPSFLRSRDNRVNSEILHIRPNCTTRNAIENEDATDLMDRRGCFPYVVVWQNHPSGSLDVRCKQHGRSLLKNPVYHIVNRIRRILYVRTSRILLGNRLCLQDRVGFANSTHIQNLSPTETEPPIPYNHHMFVCCKLPGNRLHAKCSRSWKDRHLVCIVSLLQETVQVSHHSLKRSAHQVQCPVCKNDRVFLKFAHVTLRHDVVVQGFCFVKKHWRS
mmetsp:Transcript_21330/g.50112  ORF Transcript_21330/g.50112 Transcript_21330/m.50112 type:complete len:239 (-) Transcript_21330:205-921(-)